MNTTRRLAAILAADLSTTSGSRQFDAELAPTPQALVDPRLPTLAGLAIGDHHSSSSRSVIAVVGSPDNGGWAAKSVSFFYDGMERWIDPR
jgi:hypothetical protein